jgi:outer membrane protein assembly factor BamE (lipoprotein component of BamABCDE complex)
LPCVDSSTSSAKVKAETWAEVFAISTQSRRPDTLSRGAARQRRIERRLAASLLVSLAAAGIAGCTATVDQRGNLPEPEKVAQIQPGTTTRDQVVKILGSPSSTGVFDDKNWYYISRKTKQVAFFDPDVLDQQVFVVNFDGRGVVRSVDRKELKDGRDIEPAPGATPAPGRELTFLEQVLGNIGRFSKGGSTGSSGGGGGDTSQGPKPTDPNR